MSYVFRSHALLCVILSLFAIATGPGVRAELIVYYNFNDASDPAVAVDSSGNGNDGEVIVATYTDDGGGVTGVAGDRAMDFGDHNNGAYVTVPSAADGALNSIAATDQVTVSLWILGGPNNPVNNWTFYAGPYRQLGAHIPWSNSNVYFDVAGTSDSECCTDRINTEIAPETFMGEWNHYAFVKLADQTSIYQNGTLLLEGSEMRPMNQIAELYIGADPGAANSYHGMIDDFAIFDTALSAEQIASIAAGNPIPEPATSVTAWLGILALLGACSRWDRRSRV
jgi:hypothetical protein